MASKTRPQISKLERKLSLGVDAVREFVPLVIDGERTPFTHLVKGIGSKDQYHPLRSIQKYLDALAIFELAETTDDGVFLLPRGKRFRSSRMHGALVIRNAFATAAAPSVVLRALAQTPTLSIKEAAGRLNAIDRSTETDAWLEWLAFAGIIDVRGDEIRMLQAAIDPRTLYSESERRRLRENIYRRLAMISDGSVGPGNCFHRAPEDLRKDFRNARPDDAERPMMRLVEAILFRLGFEVQVANGPRDSGDKLHFGPNGEDVVAFFLHPPAAGSDEFMGLALAVELKRTSSDKKAVTQALAAQSRVRTYFSSEIAAFALTISDSERYADKVAHDYAKATNVPHVSIETLMALWVEQERRYRKLSGNLITPIDVWNVLNDYRSQNYIEPHTNDFADAVKASSDGR
jgi:hypothetical protein